MSSLVAGSDAHLGFEGGEVTGSAGCNRLTGSYEAPTGTLVFGSIATTRKLCEAKLTDQERQMREALEARETTTIEG